MNQGFHPCDTYPIKDGVYDDCSGIDVTHLIHIGTGQNGIVALLNDSMAVKFTAESNYTGELRVACALNKLCGFAAFIKTHGWLRCRSLPQAWKDRLPDRDRKNEPIVWPDENILLIFMEYTPLRISLTNPSAGNGNTFWVNLKDDQLVKCAFILFHALYVARQELRFSHNDLHDGQIVLITHNPNEPVHLCGGYVLRGVQYVPKLIDFGASTIRDTKPDSDDIFQLWIVFHGINPDIFGGDIEDRVQEVGISKSDDSAAVRYVMKSEIFRNVYTIEEEQVGGCIKCLGRATHVDRITNERTCLPCADGNKPRNIYW